MINKSAATALPPLPIEAALPELEAALARGATAVLVAPPGAGKTTRVPLALLDQPWLGGQKILVLEPRRLAARAAAERMAVTLGERVGDTVGYRARFGSKVSRRTRIEVDHRGYFHGTYSRRSQHWTVSELFCSTSSTNARWMPILGSPWRGTRNKGCARNCGC